MSADACGQVRRGGRFLAKLLWPRRPVWPRPLGQEAAQPTGRRTGSALPEAGRQCRRRGRGIRQEASRQPCDCGEALPTRRGAPALPGGSEPLRGPQGQAVHGPASPRQRLGLWPTEGARRVAQHRFSTAGVPHDHAGQGGGVRWSLRQPHVVPDLGADEAGGLGRAPLPGLASVGWRRRTRLRLRRPWPRSDPGALGRATALPTGCRQGGPPGGKGGRSAPAIPREPSRLERRQRHALIRDEPCVGGQERWGLVSQPSLPGGVSRLLGFGAHEPTGDGQAWAPDSADPGGEAQGDRGQSLARLRPVRLGRTPLETGPPATDQVTGAGTVAPLPVGLPRAGVLPHALPGGEELGEAPAPIRECGPGPPHGRRTETQIGACGKNRAATLEQAPTQQRPQEVAKAHMGPKRCIGNNARQNVIDPVEDG
jgi:hypothetical protein